MVNHSWPWSTMVKCCVVTMIVSIWKWTMGCIGTHIISIQKLIIVNHGPTLHCDKDHLNHGQPWSNVTLWQIFSRFDNQSLSSKLNHGQTSLSEKDCLNMKMNHGQPCLFLMFIIFFSGFIYLGFIILFTWV